MLQQYWVTHLPPATSGKEKVMGVSSMHSFIWQSQYMWQDTCILVYSLHPCLYASPFSSTKHASSLIIFHLKNALSNIMKIVLQNYFWLNSSRLFFYCLSLILSSTKDRWDKQNRLLVTNTLAVFWKWSCFFFFFNPREQLGPIGLVSHA